jgi:hypothetical protein
VFITMLSKGGRVRWVGYCSVGGWGGRGDGMILFIVFSYQTEYWIVCVCICVVQMHVLFTESVYMKTF